MVHHCLPFWIGFRLQAWQLLDSQNFLVRHRRNRVWGAAAINVGQQSQREFQDLYSSTLASLESQCRFTMEDTFGDYPTEQPTTERGHSLLNSALKWAAAESLMANIMFCLGSPRILFQESRPITECTLRTPTYAFVIYLCNMFLIYGMHYI